jgi:hypothetical protein
VPDIWYDGETSLIQGEKYAPYHDKPSCFDLVFNSLFICPAPALSVGTKCQPVCRGQYPDPNQAMHTREGSSYYVYLTNVDAGPVPLASSEDSPIVGPRGRTIGVPIPASMPGDSYGQLICTTTFKTNSATGKILWAKHQGSGCLGKWVNTTER